MTACKARPVLVGICVAVLLCLTASGAMAGEAGSGGGGEYPGAGCDKDPGTFRFEPPPFVGVATLTDAGSSVDVSAYLELLGGGCTLTFVGNVGLGKSFEQLKPSDVSGFCTQNADIVGENCPFDCSTFAQVVGAGHPQFVDNDTLTMQMVAMCIFGAR